MLLPLKQKTFAKKMFSELCLQARLPIILCGAWHCIAFSQAAEMLAEHPAIQMIETDEANCIVNDGKLVSLMLVDKSLVAEVWVDRWFMNVQTADHTKQQLSAQVPIAELGCSKTNAGPQHWTIHSINIHTSEH